MQHLFPYFFPSRFFQILLCSILCSISALHLLSPASSLAEAPTSPDLFALPLEELLSLKVAIATMESSDIKEAPGIITRINREEIKSLNPRNLTELLALTPGINMVINSLNAPLFQLRGTGKREDNVLLLLDGHRLNNQLYGSSSAIINDLPLEMVDHIEIIRGPGSALYGSNAFEAVINIITIPEQEQKQGIVYGKYGTDDSLTGGTAYTYKEQDRHLVFSAVGADSNGPNDSYTEMSGYTGTIEYPSQAQNIYLNASQGDWNVLALRNRSQSGPYIGSFLYLNEGTDREYITSAFEASYSKDFDSAGALNLKASYDAFDSDCLWEMIPSRIYPPNGYFKDTTATDSRLGTELTWKKTVFDHHRLLLGSSYDHTRLFDSTLNQTDPTSGTIVNKPNSWITEEDNDHFALFIQDQLPLFTASHLTLGTRYDSYDRYGDSFNPRIGVTTPVSESSQVKLLYGTAFRAPSYFEANANSNHSGQLLNTDIKPEKLESIEAEYSVRQPLYSWSANTFYTKIDDLIETVTLIAGGTTRQNVGNVNTYGMEAEYKRHFFNNRQTVGVNGYWNHAEDDDGERVKSVPSHGAVLILTSRWTDAWSSSIQTRYTGEMDKSEAKDASGAVIATPESVAATVTGNISLAWTHGDITFRGLLYNIFDEDVSAPAPSAVSKTGDFLDDYPYQGRAAVLTLEYSF